MAKHEERQPNEEFDREDQQKRDERGRTMTQQRENSDLDKQDGDRKGEQPSDEDNQQRRA